MISRTFPVLSFDELKYLSVIQWEMFFCAAVIEQAQQAKLMYNASQAVGRNGASSTAGLDAVIEAMTYGVEVDSNAMVEAYMQNKYGSTVGVESGDYKVMSKEELEAKRNQRG